MSIFGQSATERKVRTFSLAPGFLDTYKGKQPAWGYNGLGYFVYKRTYARTKEDGNSEEFWETCQRVVEGCFNIQKVHCRQNGLPWNEPKSQKTAQDMFDRMWQFKFTPPGRGLWMMGTDMVLEKGVASLMNCAYHSTKDLDEDFTAPFTFLMDMSMLGVGVGGDTRGAGKVRLVTPRVSLEPHVVPDTREGWVDLIRTILLAFAGKEDYPSTIDFTKVRKRGEPIKGFGGVSSGPGPLQDLVKGITKILMPGDNEISFEGDSILTVSYSPSTASSRITSTQIVDVSNLIGRCVVAGNLRRSAEIMFGDPSDKDFLRLKDPTSLNALYAIQRELNASLESLLASEAGDTGGTLKASLENSLKEIAEEIAEHPLMSHRWASNNSILARVGMDYAPFVDAIMDNGEPGFAWLENARKYGRMMDPPNDKDYRVMGTNPCGEIVLESAEFCNLSETYPAHHDSLEDFKQTLKVAYLYAKTVTLIPSHNPRANAVAMRNRRIGCSMSGIAQAIEKFGYREFLDLCDNGYEYLQTLDRIYSEWLCIPRSIKMTTTKPSGSVSLLSGATPGIHFPHSEYYIRRVRVEETSPLVEAVRKAGYDVEPDKYTPHTVVVSFPIHEQNFSKSKNDITIWEQFSLAAAIQAHWADNAVSITVTVKPEEKKDIKRCLEVFETQLKSVSLLPLKDHSYVQAPYEAITKETYYEMFSRLLPLDLSNTSMHDASTEEKFCTSDVCEIKRAP